MLTRGYDRKQESQGCGYPPHTGTQNQELQGHKGAECETRVVMSEQSHGIWLSEEDRKLHDSHFVILASSETLFSGTAQSSARE